MRAFLRRRARTRGGPSAVVLPPPPPSAAASGEHKRQQQRDNEEGEAYIQVPSEGISEEWEEPNESQEKGSEEAASLAVVDVLDLPNDAYTFVFLCDICSQGFCFGLFIFLFKMTLFTVLFLDTYDTLEGTVHDDTDTLVLISQACILPVAVAMQEDLRHTYTLLSNAKYSRVVTEYLPSATKPKYYLSLLLRGVDGLYSLGINFSVLLMATAVYELLLNFAALEFLQTIDNIAFYMARDGYLTPPLEKWAGQVGQMKLPKRDSNNIFTALDSVLFVATVLNLGVFWAMYKFF